MNFNYIKLIVLFSTYQIVTSRKCVDPFEHLGCCKDVIQMDYWNVKTEFCKDYYLENSPPYNATKSCRKFYCNTYCMATNSHLVCILNYIQMFKILIIEKCFNLIVF